MATKNKDTKDVPVPVNIETAPEAPAKPVKQNQVQLDGQTYEIRGTSVFKKLESGDVEVTTGDRKQQILSLAS